MSAASTGYDADLANRKAYVLGTGPANKFHNHLFHNHNTMVNQAMKGLPQGAAPSTILSILALSDWFKEMKKKGINLLMYADDGLLYSEEEFKPNPPTGFEFALEKCRWIKGKENVEELKFLGVTYNFKTGLLRGSTRNGSTLEFGPEQENFLEYLRKISPNKYGDDIMDALVKSNVFGLALSKLYGGKFGKLEYDENVKYSQSSY